MALPNIFYIFAIKYTDVAMVINEILGKHGQRFVNMYNNKPEFRDAIDEIIQEAVKVDRINLLNHIEIEDTGFIGEEGWEPSMRINKESVINAPNIKLL